MVVCGGDMFCARSIIMGENQGVMFDVVDSVVVVVVVVVA